MAQWRRLMVLYNRFPGDDASLARAISIARSNGSDLTIVETISENAGPDFDRIDEQKLHLNRFAAGLRHEGVSARALVLHGDPLIQVIREINRTETELLIVSGRDHKRWWDFRSCDPARPLLRESPCPVWVVPKTSSSQVRRIVAGVSLGELAHEEARDLKVLGLAAALASERGCDLNVLHAWDFSGRDKDTSLSGISEENLAELEERHLISRKSRLGRLVREAVGIDVRVRYHLPRAPVEDALRRLVGCVVGGVAVVGMERRNSLTSRWCASRTEGFLSGGAYEVLTVKPDEFVSVVEDDLPYQGSVHQPPSAA